MHIVYATISHTHIHAGKTFPKTGQTVVVHYTGKSTGVRVLFLFYLSPPCPSKKKMVVDPPTFHLVPHALVINLSEMIGYALQHANQL